MQLPQTSYSRYHNGATPGTRADSNGGQHESYLNDEGSDIPCGIFVALKSEEKVDLVDATGDVLAGVVVNSFARDPESLTGDNAVKAGAMMPVLAEGAIYMHCEQVVTVTDPVYVRFSATGSQKLGAVRKDDDTGTARLVLGARFTQGGGVTSTGGDAPIVYFSRAADAAASAV